MLKKGNDLELKPAVLEKLELYILDRIASDEVKMNENRVALYILTVRARRRLSLTQIQCAIRFIDQNFDLITVQDSDQRVLFRSLIGILLQQCKPEFKTEIAAIFAWLKRDSTLPHDERQKAKEQEKAADIAHDKVNELMKAGGPDEEWEKSMAEFDEECKEIDDKFDAELKEKEDFYETRAQEDEKK